MDNSFQLTLLVVTAVMAGVGAQILATYLKVPSIVFLLSFGILLGPDVLGWLRPSLLGTGLEVIVALSVALILFEGGLNLEVRELSKVSGTLRNLVTIGTLITLIGAGTAAHWLSEFPWPIAFLYASLVVVTGPTVVSPLLKQVQVDRSVAALLEGEGVLIDPVGAVLAVVVLNVILNGNTGVLDVLGSLVIRLGVGGVIGAAGGWVLGIFLKRAQFLSDDLKNLLVLAWVWGLFSLAQSVCSESGLMAMVLLGIALRSSAVPGERPLRRFNGQLTILAISVLFVLLAADLSLASLMVLGWGGVLTVLTLMFIVRPLNAWLCTWNSSFHWRQKLFVSWVAPRGIVSASVSSLAAILLTERGFNGGEAIKALVFLTIVLTVFGQGLTAGAIAKLLGITLARTPGAVIVGSNSLSRLIARLFKENGEPVMLVDTDMEAIRKAEAEELQGLVSSGLNNQALEQAGLPSVGTFLAMTTNGEVNLVLAQCAIDEFHPPRVLAVVPPGFELNPPSNSKVQPAFSPHLHIKAWNQYLDEGDVKLGETVLREEGWEAQEAHLQALTRSQEILPLLLKRKGNLQVVPVIGKWRPGDSIVYLLHTPKPRLFKTLSKGSRIQLIPEKLAIVEEGVPIHSSG